MKLIVGLGNPGRRYAETRHNVGFGVVEELARRFGSGRARSQFAGETAEALIGSERAILLCPHTMMNLSGRSVLEARDFYKLELDELLIVCDDFNLPLARLRFRARGSAGGQKGLADVIRRLGSDQIPRLRFGIGPPPEGWDVADYVTSKFRKDERETIEQTIQLAAQAVADWTEHGTQYCMNQYNAG